MTDRIDLAIQEAVANLANGTEEHRELLVSAVQSDTFMSCVLATLMPSSDPLTTRIILAMSMMLWAGIRLERARQEADTLDRLYGMDLA